MPKDAFIRARTTVDLKERVETILARLGMNTSDAINLFFHQVELHNGLPFDVKLPNVETLKALKDLEDNTDITTLSLSEFKKSLNL